FTLAEEQASQPVFSCPVLEERFGDIRGTAILSRTPAAHLVTELIHHGQVVAFFFGKERDLGGARAFCLVPVPSSAAKTRLPWHPGVTVREPMMVRLHVWTAQNRFLDGLHW